jgi:hypothetical protein
LHREAGLGVGIGIGIGIDRKAENPFFFKSIYKSLDTDSDPDPNFDYLQPSTFLGTAEPPSPHFSKVFLSIRFASRSRIKEVQL